MGIVERKEREKQMRKEMILQASESVFFEKGLRGATLEEVAERAEVSKGTIYLYFASKEDLYYSLMTKALSMLLKFFEDTKPDESDPRSALPQFGAAYLKFSREQSYLFKMLAAVDNPVVNEQVSQEVSSELAEMSDKVLSYVAKFVQKGIDLGKFRNDLSSYEAVILFWVSLSGVLNLKARSVATLDAKRTGKDFVLHQVEYDSLYHKCVDLFMSHLVKHDLPGGKREERIKKSQKTLRHLSGAKQK